MTRSSRFPALIYALALVVVTALVYLPGLSGGFIFDDYPQVVHQKAIQAETLDAETVSAALQGFRHGVGRPLPMLSLAIDHRWWGRNPYGYKITNLAIHLVNALLVLALLRRLLSLSSRPDPLWHAGVAALLAAAWALHPLQVSTVLYVIQRMETLSLLFVLLALNVYLAGRLRQMQGQNGWPAIATCVPLAALGLACKETAVLLPLYALALELTLLRFRASSTRTTAALKLGHGLFLALTLLVAVLLAPLYSDPNVFAIRDFNAYERVLSQFRILPMYLAWILVPDPGAYLFYYDQFSPSRGMLAPVGTAIGLVVLLALAGSAVWLRRTMPLYSLGVAWFFVAHLITSSYLPLELVFEHRNYFAVLGVLLAGFAVAQRVLPAPTSSAVPVVAGLMLLVGLAGLTTIRTSTWGNPLHLAMDLAQRNPGSPRAGTGLGDQYLLLSSADPRDPFVQLAQDEYERAAALPGASPIPEQALLIMSARLGLATDEQWWTSLLRKLANQPIGPQEMAVVTSLLDLRNDGLPIDDRRLADAYSILSARMVLPASQYFAFALHALVDLDDQELARQQLALTAEHAAGDRRMLLEFAGYLREQGFPDQADYLTSQSRPEELQVQAQ